MTHLNTVSLLYLVNINRLIVFIHCLKMLQMKDYILFCYIAAFIVIGFDKRNMGPGKAFHKTLHYKPKYKLLIFSIPIDTFMHLSKHIEI